LVGGGLGYMGLAGAGKGLGGGLYDLVTGYSAEAEAERKEREKKIKDAQMTAAIEAARLRTMMPVQEEMLLQQYNNAKRNAELDLKMKNDYNYANMVNQSLRDAQLNAGLQQQIIASL